MYERMSEENVTRDENLDILSLINDNTEESTNDEVDNSINTEPTPLRKLMAAKENEVKGLVVTKEELEKGKGPTHLKSMLENDERTNAIKDYISDLDKQNDIVNDYVFPKPANKEQDIMLVAAIDELKEFGEIKTHNMISDQIIKKSDMPSVPNNTKGSENISANKESDNIGANTTDKAIETTNSEVDLEKKKQIQILIDKTGFGSNIEFTDEEKEKIENAEQIKIIQVKEEELKTIKYAKPVSQNAFQSIIKQYQIGHSSTPVIFPCSRFRATLGGLSYGELSDISLNPETSSIEDSRRRMSVIYNKIINTNVSRFTDFNDFLHKFAFEDIQLAIFGLIVSTFPEEEEVELVCGNRQCPGGHVDRDGEYIGTQYSKKYSPRTLIDYEKCGEAMLSWTEKLSELTGTAAQEAFDHSPIQEYTAIKLDHSGFVLELSRMSCYDFLTSYQDGIKYLEERFPEYKGEDIDAGGITSRDFTMAVTILPILQYVRSVAIPNENGEWIKTYNGREIAEALVSLDIHDLRIMATIVSDVDDYSTSFVLRDCKCPKCGHIQKEVTMQNLDQMVFLTYQRQMSSEINSQNSVHL